MNWQSSHPRPWRENFLLKNASWFFFTAQSALGVNAMTANCRRSMKPCREKERMSAIIPRSACRPMARTASRNCSKTKTVANKLRPASAHCLSITDRWGQTNAPPDNGAMPYAHDGVSSKDFAGISPPSRRFRDSKNHLPPA